MLRDTQVIEPPDYSGEVFNESVLDSLSAHIAVLDENGIIIAVNKAWRQFAIDNGAHPNSTATGISYLAVCAPVDGRASGDEGLEVHNGIRDLLAGRITEFHLEYPCHSPTERRWFHLRATALSGLRKGVVVSHENITARKLAEEKIKALLAEKEVILKEVHHRIKNNMNNLVGFLMLQQQALQNSGASKALQDAQGRVRNMMHLYDKLYRSEHFMELSTTEYLSPLVTEIIQTFASGTTLEIKSSIENFAMNTETLFPLGIIMNEILTNMMKYAFPDRERGLISVTLTCNSGNCIFTLEDNGIGIPELRGKEELRGFGLQLVDILLEQIKGKLHIERIHGSRFIVEFPLPQSLQAG